MSWVKNGLLLATGGIIGLYVAVASGAHGDDSERSEGLRDVDGIAVLGEKLRREAEWAMEECMSDEERVAVYADLKASIGALQEKLSERLEEQFAEERDESNKQAVQVEQVQSVRAVMDKLVHSMDETLKGLEPKRATV